MRKEIVHVGAGELHYDIAGMAEAALVLKRLGVATCPENIGDALYKGQRLPGWLKEIVARALQDDATYGYSPTTGLLATREFLARRVTGQGGVVVAPGDIVFFNGIGDAVSKIFGLLKRTARVLVPSPGYMTFTAAEAAHAGGRPLTYCLDPNRGWLPDLDDLALRIRFNPSVTGILLVNPDNPTGLVWPREVLQGIVRLAQRHNLFLLCDEVYQNFTYNGHCAVPLAQVIEDVPAIVLKSISKEMPWPGARCGWLEIYNGERDPDFKRYVAAIVNAKMQEVCSTTLPQKTLPLILGHPAYPSFLAERVKRTEARANLVHELFETLPGTRNIRSNGAFYGTVIFDDAALNARQTLAIADPRVRAAVEELAGRPGVRLDKRFAHYLLGATGIAVVPLSSFTTPLTGFRFTLLEHDEADFRRVLNTMAGAVAEFLASA